MKNQFHFSNKSSPEPGSTSSRQHVPDCQAVSCHEPDAKCLCHVPVPSVQSLVLRCQEFIAEENPSFQESPFSSRDSNSTIIQQ